MYNLVVASMQPNQLTTPAFHTHTFNTPVYKPPSTPLTTEATSHGGRLGEPWTRPIRSVQLPHTHSLPPKRPTTHNPTHLSNHQSISPNPLSPPLQVT